MTLAEKFSGTNDTYAGKVAYIYCLTCDGALSQRIEYSPTVSTTITSWKRYEYDGLNLLRVDERYDNDVPTNGIDNQDPWRKKEVSTHKPGSLGNLLGKMVYFYTGANQNTDTPSASYFYAYFYDAVGNLLWTVDNSGYLNYTFSQDAFGNDLSVSPFSGNPWSGARTYCANEHQTGKWIDPFTGLYFFHSRWYDSGVGRFVGRALLPPQKEHPYTFCFNDPLSYADVDGKLPIFIVPILTFVAHYIALEGLCAAVASLPGLLEAMFGEWLGFIRDDPDDPASGNKWPHQHCMWNCYMQKWCMPGTARAASYANEIIQTIICWITGDRGNCWSAWQEGDWKANQAGRDAGRTFKCCIDGCGEYGFEFGKPEMPEGPWWKCHDKWFCIW